MFLTQKRRQIYLRTVSQRSVCLPPESFRVHIDAPEVHLSNSTLIKTRWTLAALRAINDDKATGPDCIPGRVLRECALELASPLTRLIHHLVREHRWPELWRLHWVAPLLKKGTPSPANYRGVHLSAIMTKIAERVVAQVLVTFWDSTHAFGLSHWGFRPQRSCRVLITLLVFDELWSESRRLFERYFCCF